MKYFSPSYLLKMWVLSAPLFNSKNEGIYAKSIDNQNIKDWAGNNTNLQLLENQTLNLFHNQTIQFRNHENISSSKNSETDDFYENFLKKQGWSRDPEIAQQQLIEIKKEHNHFLKKEHENKRHKRQPNPANNPEIFQLTQPLVVDRNHPNEYMNSFRNIINELIESRFLLNIPFNNNRLYVLNFGSNIRYLQIPIIIRWPQDNQTYQRRISLLLVVSNLSIEGFINHNDQTFYYFHDQLWASEIGRPRLQNIDNVANYVMLQNMGIYSNLLPTENNSRNNVVDWPNIFYAFFELTQDISADQEFPLGSLARSLGIVTLMTSELIRFRTWENFLNDYFFESREFLQRENFNMLLDNNNLQLHITLGSNQERNLILRLNRIDLNTEETIIDNLNDLLNLITVDNSNNFIARILNQFYELSLELTSIVFRNVNELMIIIFNLYGVNLYRTLDCSRRNKREINNNLEKKYCDLKPEIDKIKSKITAIKIMNKKIKKENRKALTIYLGTENGVYVIVPEGKVYKFDGINFPITSIKLDNQGSAYITNNQEEVYHLNLHGWGSEKLNNLKSSDLNKELKMYYNENKEVNNIYYDWWNYGSAKNSIIWKKFNLKTINPVDNFKKFSFLGKDSDFSSLITWGHAQCPDAENGVYYDCPNDNKADKANRFDGHKLSDLIINQKIIDPCLLENEKYKIDVQSYRKWRWLSAYLEYSQVLGLTFYWENENYYLQLLSKQWTESWGSSWGGGSYLYIGNGIRLYNDDNALETQIQNPDDRKKIDIFEEKNITKWTDDFTKSINHQQHLPIDNKTNFVTNNITSL